MAKEIEVPCPECKGDGFRIEPGHVCLGDDRECVRDCPIPMQVQCELCEGNCTLTVEEINVEI